MKKSFFLLILAIFFMSSIASPALAKKSFKKGDKLRITTSKTLLKNVAKPFGAKILKTLEKGDTVSYMDKESSWFKVEYEGTEGFIPQKSLIESKKFKSFSRTAKVTETDMAAATKGFSPEVEKKNRENKELKYDLMDKAEAKSTVKDPLKTLKSFREKGKLGEFQ